MKPEGSPSQLKRNSANEIQLNPIRVPLIKFPTLRDAWRQK